jgi:CRP-like cAMP-binding protein
VLALTHILVTQKAKNVSVLSHFRFSLQRVERDSSYSVSRGSGASLRRRAKHEFDHPRLGNNGSVGHLNARSRSVAKMDAILKGTSARNMRQEKSKFRLARIGPGFVVGVNEASTGLQNIGIHIAVTECRLYFLSYDKMREIEMTDASLVLNLYKLLAHLSARREEMAIEQLSTLHTIMSSDPIGSQPMDRKTLGAVQRAMMSIDG